MVIIIIVSLQVVDSRARTNADGALQQQARRQLEVFQSQIPGGHLQVIKTQTVSSSRWSNKSELQELPVKDFENLQVSCVCLCATKVMLVMLQLSLNPLDLSSQKSKANVGRSVGRRPPSRPRARDESLRTAQQNLYRVSRLCHQIHENAVKQTIKRQNGVNGHPKLTRTKSTSSEDLHLEDKSSKSIEDLEDLEQLQSWRRTSKLRRSLQYPKETKPQTSKPSDLPENSGSVRKIREELEKGRRLSTALRGNNVDLEALDQILQSISSSSSNHSDKLDESQDDSDTKKQKRNSFVTVETLQEVRGRLRRTSSPSEDIYKPSKEEETDDGIVTEDTNEMPVSEKSRVRSYVYGMETMMNKKPILGTGSLESRSKLLNGGTSLRNEDWYNRRKSYGFEQVHNHTDTSSPISLKSKGRVESSTDSGICRSSEIVIVPTAKTESFDCDEKNFTSVKQISSIFDQGFNKDLKSTTITIPIVSKPNSNFVDLCWDDIPEKEVKRHSIAVDESKYVTNHNDNKFRRTSLAINPTLDDPGSQNRKSKKVEFCKTEVHFAAESGKVNIVETDEKPPPTNNFRRRRRNSGPIITEDFERNGLPVLHFGDSSYEKVLLGVADEDFEPTTDDNTYQNLHSSVPCGTVTVNTTSNQLELQEEEKKDSVENVKGILKNKPIKPTPYHLGEDHFLNSNSDSDSGKWGVRLKPVQKNDPPFWKSTVTLHNTVYGQDNVEKDEQPEFQKLLRNLRPTSGNKPDLLTNQRNSENFSSVKFVTSTDNRRPWSVADRVKLTEENKVYSTKVNFGDGGTAVVENDRFGQKEQDLLWKNENPVKVLDTIKNDCIKTNHVNIPQQLEALKKLYEDVQSDSDADKEVQVLMGRMDRDFESAKDDNTSEISGSWSKMRACRILNEHFNKTNLTREIPSARISAKVEKDDSNENIKHRFGVENSLSNLESDQSEHSPKAYRVKLKESKYSPIVTRKSSSFAKRADLKTASASEKLSSPSLVGRSFKLDLHEYRTKETEFVNVTDTKLHQKHSSNEIVLRQPKKSEMTYFGVNVSPNATKKNAETVIHKETKLSEKPDLLQHMKTDSPNSRSRLRSSEKEKSPIYENIVAKNKSRHGREFDSNILEELTKAADQILQAVNGFTDDDSQNKHSGDERNAKKEPLETITESKSWSHDKKVKGTGKQTNTKIKLKHTSSTSSVESLSKDKKINQGRKSLQAAQVKKKNVVNESSTARATTKARRLQRASSREALLQSHGSSSEDLGTNVEVPQRKPRQIKKTKTTQLTVTNGLEMHKRNTPPNPPRRKRDDPKERTDVPEIRHKTAVSTIRSTAEKSSRDKSKSRIEESKKRVPQKRESSRGNCHYMYVVFNDNATFPGLSSRTDPKKTVSSREISNHRISTAYVPVCRPTSRNVHTTVQADECPCLCS
ncbi:microtubule-associated protein futsch [Asbolus verrucosus]|uniref:Microtubule-associated protein futsch n=1 Tax=Asbolus verrucosus TaxID=1661398 RepID=A0A482VQU9_ASBVE|nr:microtubule-associated protein futsch [Asbolus verrucosus]